jgi:DNA-binding NarL/FixJ family response regulator
VREAARSSGGSVGDARWSRVGERRGRVLALMAEGLTDDSIARALGVSRRTVQTEVTALADELGARTRFQIALLASRRGLI